ncbi:elongation factor P [Candidatus Roizmanbacteria bacterium]|nr:elongation factor P [Candidatus Roizmanbacteria bacterium]
MLNVTELRHGMYFQEDGTPFEVLSYEHTKMGRGNATVRVRVHNLLTGAVVSKTYISSKRVEEAELDQQEGTFLYRTNTDFVFESDDDHIEIPREKIGEQGIYLKKGMDVRILVYQNEPIGVTLPIKAEYSVKEAPPDARGNSANASTKEVLLENTMKVKTPMFIKEGDTIIVDTRTGEYISRA